MPDLFLKSDFYRDIHRIMDQFGEKVTNLRLTELISIHVLFMHEVISRVDLIHTFCALHTH